MKFGYQMNYCPVGAVGAESVCRLAETAEDLGYDAVALGDHISHNGPIVENLTTLALWAGRTSRVKLISNILMLPLRNPAVTAKAVASLDFLSQGRVILGIGVGGEGPKEFEVCGVPIGERGARTDEAMEMLRKLWTEQSASHAGRFWQFENISMDPKPAQAGGPPIWVGGRSDKALRRAALAGDGWLPYLVSPNRYAASLAKIRTIAATGGKSLDCFTLAHMQFICVDKTFEAARDKASSYMSNMYKQSFEGLVEKFCALGTVEDCVRWINHFADIGVQTMVLSPVCPLDEQPEQMRIYAREIIPALRQL